MLHVLVRTLAVLLLIVLVAPFGWRAVTGDDFMQVTSGSMEPLYQVGDVIVVREPRGDELTELGTIVVVAFQGSTDGSRYVHRVDEVLEDGAWLRGDNNDRRDPQPVSQSQVLGTPRVALTGVAADALSLALTTGGRIVVAVAAIVLLFVRLPGSTSTDRTAAGRSPQHVRPTHERVSK